MNAILSANHSDAAFYRNRKAMLIYPVIILPFLMALFWILGGGRGERYVAEEAQVNRAGANGFNPQMPNAKNSTIEGNKIDNPAYGKSAVGQVLSNFTNTRQDSATKGLQAMPVDNQTTGRASSLAALPTAPTQNASRSVRQPNAAAVAATRSSRQQKGYYYNPPGYGRSPTDQQLDQQLRQYENRRETGASAARSASTEETSRVTGLASERAATVRLTDNLQASRLSDVTEAESPFLTAPTGGSRPQPTRAVLSEGNYGSKKIIAWMIPVVVHEDQLLRDGEQVKLRLLKEITADGVTIPANTILYAICQLTNDRLRLTVRNLQLGGQLIPLDLDVYDTDGSSGINVPGLSQSGQVGGQVRSSAIQGVQLPGIGGLASTVLNSARTGAAQSVRQTSIRLRAGYNLFLKAQ